MELKNKRMDFCNFWNMEYNVEPVTVGLLMLKYHVINLRKHKKTVI